LITGNNCYISETCAKEKTCSGCELQSSDAFCEKLWRVDTLLENALLTWEQRQRVDIQLEPSSPDVDVYRKLWRISQRVLDFASSGASLYMYSNTHCGNGKTMWAIRMIQDYILNIWYKSDVTCKALFINVPRFLLESKSDFDNPSEYVTYIKNNIMNADIVVWDEIGNKLCTQFEIDILLNLINMRTDARKANIYTSNLSGDELRGRVGERLYSRIIMNSIVYQFLGPDRRTPYKKNNSKKKGCNTN